MKSAAILPFLIFAIGLVWLVMGLVNGAWVEIAIGVAITGLAVVGYRKQRQL